MKKLPRYTNKLLLVKLFWLNPGINYFRSSGYS